MPLVNKPTATGVIPATTLPGSPTDGQQAILVDSTSTPTYGWLLGWSATASKWIFIGGSPQTISVSTGDASTGGSGVFTDFSTHAGPSLTVVRAGTYVCHWGATGTGNASGTTSYVGLSVAASTPSTGDNTSMNASFNDGTSGTGYLVTGSIAASSVIKCQCADGDSTRRISFTKRWLEVTPVWVT